MKKILFFQIFRNITTNQARKKIIQIEEKTEEDRRLNETINLWKMRKK